MAFLVGLIMYALFGASGPSAVSFFGSSFSSSSSAKGVCLFSPACLGSSIFTLSELEKAQLGVNIDTAPSVVYTISFAQTIGFYVLDIVLYMLLTWYFDKIIPSEYGTTRPWYFLFQRRFWCGNSSPKGYSLVNADFEELHDADIPSLYERKAADNANVKGVMIRRIAKEFALAGKEAFRAVNEVSLDMFEGEVFSLLGHNGAGK
jgi:ATP-binding cassette subfamily A (ABC1) protein 3